MLGNVEGGIGNQENVESGDGKRWIIEGDIGNRERETWILKGPWEFFRGGRKRWIIKGDIRETWGLKGPWEMFQF